MRNVKLDLGNKMYEATTIKEIFKKMIDNGDLPKAYKNDLDDLETIISYIVKNYNKCTISA